MRAMKQRMLAEHDRAFELAYFILGEPLAAGRATLRALGLWDARCSQVRKRRYFQPLRGRVKASLSELGLLQTLVYRATLSEEQHQEQNAAEITDDALIIRFIKHLAFITTERNAFYVTLGLCALLHDYSYTETADVYDFVMQDGARIKGVEYFRKRKQLLLKELTERFGAYLQWHTTAHGEKRWRARAAREAPTELVQRCLAAFTPWETDCVLSDQTTRAGDAARDTPQPALNFNGTHPDGENAVELNRLHTLWHPVCFARLIQILAMEAPDARLSLPLLLNQNHSDDAPLSPAKSNILDDISRQLKQDAQRRRQLAPNTLTIKVEGQIRVQWDLSQPLKLDLAPTERLIEAWATDAAGPLLWFSHLLLPREMHATETKYLYHTQGRECVLTLQPYYDAEGEYAGSVLLCEGRRTLPAASLFSWPILIYAATALLLGALALGLWQRRQTDSGPLTTRNFPPAPSASATPPMRPASATPSISPKIVPTVAPTPKQIHVPAPPTAATPARIASAKVTPSPAVRENGGLRSSNPVTPDAFPANISSVFVETPAATNVPAQKIYAALLQRLRETGRLPVTDALLEASHTLRLRVTTSGSQVTVQAELSLPSGAPVRALPRRTGPDAVQLGREVADELLQFVP